MHSFADEIRQIAKEHWLNVVIISDIAERFLQDWKFAKDKLWKVLHISLHLRQERVLHIDEATNIKEFFVVVLHFELRFWHLNDSQICKTLGPNEGHRRPDYVFDRSASFFRSAACC